MVEISPSIENLGPGALKTRIALYLLRHSPIEPGKVKNPAAVLIPIVERPEPGVLLTLRPHEMPLHAGQICFPGGRFQIEDTHFEKTALRETEEETGIPPSAVELLGFLEPYNTATGFTVIPVVGILGGEFDLTPNRREVEEIFEVPLAHLLDPANHQRRSAERNGALREFYAIQYRERLIWGATAGMIVSLSRRLREI